MATTATDKDDPIAASTINCRHRVAQSMMTTIIAKLL
jgi:hypothetical protein